MDLCLDFIYWLKIESKASKLKHDICLKFLDHLISVQDPTVIRKTTFIVSSSPESLKRLIDILDDFPPIKRLQITLSLIESSIKSINNPPPITLSFLKLQLESTELIRNSIMSVVKQLVSSQTLNKLLINCIELMHLIKLDSKWILSLMDLSILFAAKFTLDKSIHYKNSALLVWNYCIGLYIYTFNEIFDINRFNFEDVDCNGEFVSCFCNLVAKGKELNKVKSRLEKMGEFAIFENVSEIYSRL